MVLLFRLGLTRVTGIACTSILSFVQMQAIDVFLCFLFFEQAQVFGIGCSGREGNAYLAADEESDV